MLVFETLSEYLWKSRNIAHFFLSKGVSKPKPQ
jgi:hypothetical protein